MNDEKDVRRRLGLKDTLQIAALVLTVSAIVWRGGQLTEQLSSIGATVAKMETTLDTSLKQQAQQGADIRVLQEAGKFAQEKLQNHEARLTRLEDRRRDRID